MTILTENTFESEIKKQPVCLVDFYADWCGPCKMLGPVIEEVANEHPELFVAKVNVDDAPRIAGKLGITSIPYVVLFRNGEVDAVSIGFKPKAELLKALNL